MTAIAMGLWLMFIGSVAAVETERQEKRAAEREALRQAYEETLHKQIVVNMPAPGQP